jgi:hypothetical protein
MYRYWYAASYVQYTARMGLKWQVLLCHPRAAADETWEWEKEIDFAPSTGSDAT